MLQGYDISELVQITRDSRLFFMRRKIVSIFFLRSLTLKTRPATKGSAGQLSLTTF